MKRLLTRVIVPTKRLRAALPLALAAAAGLLVWQTRAVQRADTALGPLAQHPRFHQILCRTQPPEQPAIDFSAAEIPHVIEIARGQTLGGVLGDLGLGAVEVAAAVEALKPHVDVRAIRAGQTCLAYLDAEQRLDTLQLYRDDGRVELSRQPAGWQSSWQPFVRRTERRRIAGRLDGALETAVRRAGADVRIAYRMADVLQWDLDFNRDLRLGDRFEVLYQDVYLDDAYGGPGSIDALRYENRGVQFEAYRFDDGYYDAEGRPLQKMFLRSPLPFSRVTSRFSHARFHPILKVERPHYGVDYGAPRGTPVRVTAHGVVASAGRSGGAGNMVKVRHPNGYLSAYLHLSRFAKGIHPGVRVRQGDVIGYVGATGLATGPHLDYRVQKDRRWIDPLRITQTPAEPIPAADMPSFLARRDTLRQSLSAGETRAPHEAAPVPRSAHGAAAIAGK